MRSLLLFAALVAASPALAQSSGRTPGGATVPGAVLYCWNGVINSDGTLQVVMCADPTAGTVTVKTGQSAVNVAPTIVVPTTQCPANPISKKIPPLC